MPFCNVTTTEACLLQGIVEDHDANSVAILDHAVLVTENLMKRYAERQSSNSNGSHGSGSTKLNSPSWHEAMKFDEKSTVRIYPYPSLFLHPLSLEISDFSMTPPSFLLAKSISNTSSTEKNMGNDNIRKYRDMLILNGGASDMVTVLQGECGIAVVSPISETGVHRSSYIMSPDATSCIIVACRVGIHPNLRNQIMKLIDENTTIEDRNFALRCCETFTAGMGHFDGKNGLVQALHGLLWDAAMPAWFHAALYKCNDIESSNENSTLKLAKILISRLHQIARSKGDVFDDSSSPSMFVEWFVVGGIRCRKDTESVVAAIFTTFFASEKRKDESNKGSRRQRHDYKRHHILKTSFSLSEVLTTDNCNEEYVEKDKKDLVFLEHSLREDGVCFWSLNTVLRPWSLGSAGKLYYNSACWGILLDVRRGVCWPAMIQPSTRDYPLAAARHILLMPNYRWICPLESEGKLRVSCGPTTSNGATYFGLSLSSLKNNNSLNVSLATYVGLFLKRLEEKVETSEGASSSFPPILVRYGEWERLESDINMDSFPDSFFLGSSTTPHCEPPDFVQLARQRFKTMTDVGPEDLFTKGTVGILV